MRARTLFARAAVAVLALSGSGLAGATTPAPATPAGARACFDAAGAIPLRLTLLGCVGGMQAGAAPALDVPLECQALPAAAQRCPEWIDRYDHPGGHAAGGFDVAMALRAFGGTVYTTGFSIDAGNGQDIVTLATDAATGARRWTARVDVDGGDDLGVDIAVSPDGARVYVGGSVTVAGSGADFAFLAYDAATGDELWRVIDGTAVADHAYAMTLSEDGSTLYATGPWNMKGGCFEAAGCDWGTVAIDTDTATVRWRATHDGPGAGVADLDIPNGVVAHGDIVAVAGYEWTGVGHELDLLVVGYRAGDGAVEWESRYDAGTGAFLQWDYATDIAAADGMLYVGGGSAAPSTAPTAGLQPQRYLALGLDAATGARAWVTRHAATEGGWSLATALDVAGGRVFLTGGMAGTGSTENSSDWDLGTLALDAANGALLWEHSLARPGYRQEYAFGVAADDDGVYVAGTSGVGAGVYSAALITETSLPVVSEAAVAAYDPATGARRWSSRYGVPVRRSFGVEVTAAGGRVHVSGQLPGEGVGDGNNADLAVLSYAAR